MTNRILTKVKKYVALSAIGLIATLTANQRAEAIATVDDPDKHLTTDFNGVGRLFGPSFYTCGASVLGTGRHLLTAAHCAFNSFTGELYDLNTELKLDLGLDELGLDETVNIDKFILHPEYSIFDGNNDIAIIELAEELPAEIDRYDIYRGDDEFGQIGYKVGYGGHGTGLEGVSLFDPKAFDSQKRVGQNVYEAGGDIFNGLFEIPYFPDFSLLPETTLSYDFDSGLAKNDVFGQLFGSEFPELVNLGLGVNEVRSVWGDSGGPMLINGQIAGITSLGFGDNWIPALEGIDLIPDTNSSFGEIAVDTRVSYYADWIDKVTVPEPSTLVGLISVVGAGSILKRKKRNRS